MKARKIGTLPAFDITGVIMNGSAFNLNEVEIIHEPEPDWNQIRIQASIAAMQGIISDGGNIPDGVAFEAVRFAEAIITELKKQKL